MSMNETTNLECMLSNEAILLQFLDVSDLKIAEYRNQFQSTLEHADGREQRLVLQLQSISV